MSNPPLFYLYCLYHNCKPFQIENQVICEKNNNIIKKVETKLASTLEIMLDNVFHHQGMLLLIPNLYLTR